MKAPTRKSRKRTRSRLFVDAKQAAEREQALRTIISEAARSALLQVLSIPGLELPIKHVRYDRLQGRTFAQLDIRPTGPIH